MAQGLIYQPYKSLYDNVSGPDFAYNRRAKGKDRFPRASRVPGRQPHDAPGPQRVIVGHFNNVDIHNVMRLRNDDLTYAPFSERPEDNDIRQYDPLLAWRPKIGTTALFGNEPYPLVTATVRGIKKNGDWVFYGYATNPGPTNGRGGKGVVSEEGATIITGTAQFNNVTPRTIPCLMPMRIDLNPYAVRGDFDEILCGVQYPNDSRPPTRLVPQHIPIDAPHVNHDINVTAKAVHFAIRKWLQHGVIIKATEVLKVVDDYLKQRLVEEENPLDTFALIEAGVLLMMFSHCFYQQNIQAFSESSPSSVGLASGVTVGGGESDAAKLALDNMVESTKVASAVLNKARQQDHLAIDRFKRYMNLFEDKTDADHPMFKTNTNINAAHFPYCDQSRGSPAFISAAEMSNPFVNQVFASRVFSLQLVLHTGCTRSITAYNEYNASRYAGLCLYETNAGDSGSVVV